MMEVMFDKYNVFISIKILPWGVEKKFRLTIYENNFVMTIAPPKSSHKSTSNYSYLSVSHIIYRQLNILNVHWKYLFNFLISCLLSKTDIRNTRRITQAKLALKILHFKLKINLEIEKQFLICSNVWAVTLYGGCETWTIEKSEKKG